MSTTSADMVSYQADGIGSIAHTVDDEIRDKAS